MRAPSVVLGTLALLLVACSSQDEGNLVIRCPTANGAVAVANGETTIDGEVVSVSVEVTAPVDVEHGATFVVDLRSPAADGPSPQVECIRVRKQNENVQWDAVPWRVSETRGGPTTHVRAEGGQGPHWPRDERVAVMVWLRTSASGRHVVDLGARSIRGADGS